MKALITGATGFIGSHLVEALLKRKYKVHCLIRKTSDLSWLKNHNVHFIPVDYQDKNALCQGVTGMDYIFHVGAVINAKIPETYYRVNVENTKNLVEACVTVKKKVKKFVFVSSIAAAGPGEKGIFKTEKNKNRPVSHYGKSKLMAEKIVMHHKKEIPVVIIRPPNVIGPRQKELFDVIKLIKKRLIPQIGNGDKQTSLCYVEDLVEALILAAEKKESSGQIYFVTDTHAYSWEEITNQISLLLGVGRFSLKIPFLVAKIIAFISESISSIIGKPPIISRETIEQSRSFYWLFKDSKIRSELDFQSKTDMKEGIRKTINWYRDHQLI